MLRSGKEVLRDALAGYYLKHVGEKMSALNVVICGLCIVLGGIAGVMWERARSDAEWRRWVTLSERIDSVSAMAEHDLYVLEDRLGLIDERVFAVEVALQ